MDTGTNTRGISGPLLRVTGAYAVTAAAWILFSDRALVLLADGPEQYATWSIYKGWAFVVVTTTLLAALLARELAAREAAQDAMRQARDLAERNAAQLRAVMEGTPDAVWIKDLDGRYVMVNSATCRVLERPLEQVLGRDDREVFADAASAQRILDWDTRVRSTGEAETREERLVLGGELRTYLTTKGPVRDSAGRLTGLYGVARDITDRLKAAEQLRQSEERLRLSLEQCNIGGFEVRLADGSTVRTREHARIFGYPDVNSPWTRESFYQHVVPEDRESTRQLVERALAGEGRWQLECRVRRDDGQVRWIWAAGGRVDGPPGDPGRVVGVVQDITERKQMEQHLQHARQMETVGQLAGGVAHDFNNLLAAIQLHLHVARASPGLSTDVVESLDGIAVAADRAADLTRQLLIFVRRQVVQARVLDLNHVVHGLVKMFRRVIEEHVTLDMGLQEGPLPVRADEGMIQQVLINLVVNARDAMRGGGKLSIRTSRGPAPEGLPQVPGGYVVLTVEDTGTGIPPEVLPRIFEPFFTTKEPGRGTGLGLATVKSVVDQLQGHVDVDSTPGRGTRFRIHVPCAEAPGAAQAAPAAVLADVTTPPPASREAILLVEDDPAVRRVTRRVLEKRGYRVVEAADARAALAAFEMARTPFDLLFTDLVLPDGLGGHELARRLKERQPRLRVVFTSGYSPESTGSALQPGDHFLQKPASVALLVETVRHCLDA